MLPYEHNFQVKILIAVWVQTPSPKDPIKRKGGNRYKNVRHFAHGFHCYNILLYYFNFFLSFLDI